MLLLPAEHSAPGSLEECHGVIAMTMYCQLDGLMLDAGVVITPLGCPEKEWLIAPRYCQSAMRGWTFQLLLAHHGLLDELGICN